MKPDKNNSDALSGGDCLFSLDANEGEKGGVNAKSSWVDLIKDKFFMWPIGLLFLYLILTGGLGANAWRTQSLSLLSLLDMMFVQIFLGVIVEECAFRGYLLERLLKVFSVSHARLMVTLLFTSLHIDLWYFTRQALISSEGVERYVMLGVTLGMLLGLLVFSFFANAIYLKYRNIKFNIVFHMAWNVLFALQSLLQGALM